VVVREKISQWCAPLIGAEYFRDNLDKCDVPVIGVSLTKGTSIIRINIKGIEDDEATYFKLLDKIIAEVDRNHKKAYLAVRNNIEIEIRRIGDQITQFSKSARFIRV